MNENRETRDEITTTLKGLNENRETRDERRDYHNPEGVELPYKNITKITTTLKGLNITLNKTQNINRLRSSQRRFDSN